MPHRLRQLSGADVLHILGRFGFEEVGRRGSHVKLRRVFAGGRETLTVPFHRDLDAGTVHAIFRQACRHVGEADLRPYFFSD